MDTVTISPKYQVVIPKSVRKQLRLEPGQVLQVIAIGNRIEFLPVRTAQELRGMLRGCEVGEVREEVDRM